MNRKPKEKEREQKKIMCMYNDINIPNKNKNVKKNIIFRLFDQLRENKRKKDKDFILSCLIA